MLKVGDKVRINKNLHSMSSDDIPYGVNTTMENYAGQEAVIENIVLNFKNKNTYSTYSNFDGHCYFLDIDGERWKWSNVMFENEVITNTEEDILLCCTCFLN